MNEMTINNVALPILEWNGERVITFKDIDRVHGRVEGTAKNRYRSNQKHFVEGTDYYKVTRKEFVQLFGTLNVLKGNPNLPVFLLTKSGYLMIVKTMDDDKAWKVQRALVNAYFTLQKLAEKSKEEVVQSTQPVPEILSLVEEQKKLFELEMEKNESFREMLMKSFQNMANIVMVQSEMISKQNETIQKLLSKPLTPTKEKSTKKTKETSTKKQNENVNREELKVVPRAYSSEYFRWKKSLNDMIIGFDKREIFKRTYKYMQKNYGICWDQESKEYKELYGKKPNSTLELIYFMEKENFVLRQLFESCLITICNANQKIKQEIRYPIHNVKEMEVLANYLIKESNNNSPNGVTFWRDFFESVHEKNKNQLPEYEQKYRKEKSPMSGRRISKLELIRTYEVLENFYVIQFNTWVKKEYGKYIEGLKR